MKDVDNRATRKDKNKNQVTNIIYDQNYKKKSIIKYNNQICIKKNHNKIWDLSPKRLVHR